MDGADQLMDLSDRTWKRLCPGDPLMGSGSFPTEDISGSSPAARQLSGAEDSPRSDDSGCSGLGLEADDEAEMPLEDQAEYMHALEWLLSSLFTLIGGAPKVTSSSWFVER